MSFESEYADLLIKQYWEKPKAAAEIATKAGTWRKTFEWLDSFTDEFDIDTATGARLDVIGRIVGIKRTVPFVVPKIAFGFAENPNSRGFDDGFSPLADRAPFQDKFERAYTNLQLSDTAYRFFIRARIAKNVGGPYLADDQGIAIQEVIGTLFDGAAYALDKKNMTLTLYVSPQYSVDNLRAILRLDLMPKPQGVRWAVIVQAGPDDTFGFADNINSLPFADKFDLINQPGGRLANKVVF